MFGVTISSFAYDSLYVYVVNKSGYNLTTKISGFGGKYTTYSLSIPASSIPPKTKRDYFGTKVCLLKEAKCEDGAPGRFLFEPVQPSQLPGCSLIADFVPRSFSLGRKYYTRIPLEQCQEITFGLSIGGTHGHGPVMLQASSHLRIASVWYRDSIVITIKKFKRPNVTNI